MKHKGRESERKVHRLVSLYKDREDLVHRPTHKTNVDCTKAASVHKSVYSSASKSYKKLQKLTDL